MNIPGLESLHSLYPDFLTYNDRIERRGLEDPDEYVLEEVAFPNSEDYSKITESELIDTVDSAFERALTEEDYIWRSDISPSELQELLTESNKFSAVKRLGEADRYGFVAEGNLEHFHNHINRGPEYHTTIRLDSILLTGTIYEKQDRGLFDCQTDFSLP